MAEEGRKVNIQDQNCPVCLESFKVPRTLPCQHTFCHKCLSDYIVTSAQNSYKPSFSCPVCRTIVYPSSKAKDLKEWATSFPQNINVFALGSTLKEKVEYVCDSCLTNGSCNNSSGFCLDCKEHVCDACIEIHGKLNALRLHKIMSRDEISQNPSLAINIDLGNRCVTHENEIQYFCKDHDAIGCVACVLTEHRTCKNMVHLKTDAEVDLEDDPVDVVNAMKRIEEHLREYIEKTESNLKTLETETKDLSKVIKEAKESIVKMLDTLGENIDQQGKQIFQEEALKTSENVRQCQSLLAATRNSYQLLEAIIRFGSKAQVFITARQANKQLEMYRHEVLQKYRKLESRKVGITLHDSLKSLLCLQDTKLASVDSEENNEELQLSRVVRNPKCEACAREALLPPVTKVPDYTGATFLISDSVMLVDKINKTSCLYDSEFQLVSYYTFSGIPHDVCVIDEGEVAVSLTYENKIQFLTATAPITPTRSITTKYYCSGLAALSKDTLVISGYKNTCNQNCYWSIVNASGKEEYYHEIDQKGGSYTYLALNKSKTRLYVSCHNISTVYCFGLDGHLYFRYDILSSPMGIGLDRDGYVYMVGYGSSNLHQLSPDGLLLQVITSGIPKTPQKIAFHRNGSTFLLTNDKERKKIHVFQLK
ncbi:hypothetical protein CHS0354_034143 [Potamilus streckersoni]|uniref:RING-type domain-containing protein n=1 Tax=Potamilus streckersoni TaxID=2493646 RepID=A0AAE0SMG6_9BIVA|nr:hypothetical protein CHS0354_034143 [Potamilus streckersoni]